MHGERVEAVTLPSVAVALFQPVIAHYRVGLFSRVAGLSEHDVVLFSEAPSMESAIIDGSHQVELEVRHSRTLRIGPIWFVPRSIREALIGDWDAIVLSWNVRQIELLVVLLIARLRGIRTLLWGHGVGKSRRRSVRLLRRLQARLASAVLVYSSRGRDDVLAIEPAAAVTVVENTTGREPPSADDLLAQPAYHVGYVGRLYPEKHLDRLLEALAIVRESGLPLRATLLGDGPSRSTLESLAHTLGDGVVQFLPPTGDWDVVKSFLKQVDLVIFPEIAGLGVVDAFAAARGVVAISDTSRNPPEVDNVVDGVTGLLYPDATPDSLARCLLRAYTTPNLLADMSRAAADHYKARLLIDDAAHSFVAALSA